MKLNPCPFCTCKGIEVETVTDGDGIEICSHVECPACLARGPQEALLQNAVDFWNEATSSVTSTDSAPGHTDLMVSPESIDQFMEANPLPPDGGESLK